jgi:hypothetical protein
MPKIGYLRKDDDGHWYLVPENFIHVFDSFYEAIENHDSYSEEWENAIDEFVSNCDEYRLSGGIDNLKVLME